MPSPNRLPDPLDDSLGTIQSVLVEFNFVDFKGGSLGFCYDGKLQPNWFI